MASDPEEKNLAALRSAVLASLKTNSNASLSDAQSGGDDDDDLEALRQAALRSRKSAVKSSEQTCPPPTSNMPQGRKPFPRWRNFRPGHRGNGQHKFRPFPRSNLIVINTVPLENDASTNSESNSVSKLLLPSDKSAYGGQLPKLDSRTKPSGRFSRFESSSQSEESDLDSEDSSSDTRDGAAFSSEGHQRLGASDESTTQDIEGHEECIGSDEFGSSQDTSDQKIDCNNKTPKTELRLSLDHSPLGMSDCLRETKSEYCESISESVSNTKNCSETPDMILVKSPEHKTNYHLNDVAIKKEHDITDSYNHDYLNEQFNKPIVDKICTLDKAEAQQKKCESDILTNQISLCKTKDEDCELYADVKSHISTSSSNCSDKIKHNDFLREHKSSDLRCSDLKNGINSYGNTDINSNASLQYGRADNKSLSTWDLRMELKRRKEERSRKGMNRNRFVVSPSQKTKDKYENISHSRSSSATSRSSSYSSRQSESSEKSWSDTTSDTSSCTPSRSPSRSRSSSPLVKSVLSVVKPVSQKSDSVQVRYTQPTQELVDMKTIWRPRRSDRAKNTEHISRKSRFDAEKRGRSDISKNRKTVSSLSFTDDKTSRHLEREVYLGNCSLSSGTSFEKSKKLPVHMRLGLPQKHLFEPSQKDKQCTSPKSDKKDTRSKDKTPFPQTVREVSFSSRGSSDICIVSSKPQKTDNDSSLVKHDRHKRPHRESSHDHRKRKR